MAILSLENWIVFKILELYVCIMAIRITLYHYGYIKFIHKEKLALA